MPTVALGTMPTLSLDSLPFPAAVVEESGTCIACNSAFANGEALRIGDTAPRAGDDSGAMTNAEDRESVRRQQYEACRSGHVVMFEEVVPGRPAMLWICRQFEPGANQILIFGINVESVRRSAKDEERLELSARLQRDLQAPLAALVGLANSFIRNGSPAGIEHVELIERNGRLLLAELQTLVHPEMR